MEGWQREHIKKNLLTLVQNTECSERLLNRLVSNGAIGNDDIEELEFLRFKPVAQAKMLYDILMSRSHAYDAMTAALLANHQMNAYDILNEPLKYRVNLRPTAATTSEPSDEPIYANIQFHEIHISPPSPIPPTPSPLPSPVLPESRNNLHVFRDKLKQKRSRSLSPSAVFHKMRENIGNFWKGSNVDVSDKDKTEPIRKLDIGSPTGFRHVSHFPRPGYKSQYAGSGHINRFSEHSAVKSRDNNFAEGTTTWFVNQQVTEL